MAWISPNNEPLIRLQVTDGLLVNAQRWQLAHNYHRQRQNLYYQSLHLPGIVWGLGVRIIAAPQTVALPYRDRRWLQIQPGIAIDDYGNIIIVPEAVDFRIVSQATVTAARKMVYLVIRYVDPEQLQIASTIQGRETFRLDEKTAPPKPGEIELCRLCLQPGEVVLENSPNVFFPQENTLDLRYRRQARVRPLGLVSLAMLAEDARQHPATVAHLNNLLRSIEGLYAPLVGDEEVGLVSLRNQTAIPYELLYLSEQKSQGLNEQEVNGLEAYLKQGGTILVEISTQNTKIEELKSIESQLQDTLSRIDTLVEMTTSSEEDTILKNLVEMKPDVEAELNNIRTELAGEIEDISVNYRQFAQRMGTPLDDWESLVRDHPLRNQPFLFAALPEIERQPLQLLVGSGLIVVIGNLSSAWGLDEQLVRSRQTIRTAQEIGINILYFAWRRRQMMQFRSE